MIINRVKVVILVILYQCFAGNSFMSPTLRNVATRFTVEFRVQRLYANPRRIDVGNGFIHFPKETIKHSLLTAEEERSLATQYKLSVHVQAQRNSISNQLGRLATDSEVAKALGISSEQIPLLTQKGELAKSSLVQANMRLVFHIAKYYRYRGVAYLDLVQEGTFGLMKAVDKYDSDRGFRFSTYASCWIKQALSRTIAEKSRIVRLPVHIHDLVVSIAKAEKEFTSTHHRKPTPFDISEKLCLPIQKVELLMKSARDVGSIDESVYANKGKMVSSNEVQVKEVLPSFEVQPSSINERNSMQEELRKTMRSLSEREIQVVELRFGLLNGTPQTLEEVGNILNVTRERIRQIESRALAKMRHAGKSDVMKEFFQDHSVILDSSSSAQSIYAPQAVGRLKVFAE